MTDTPPQQAAASEQDWIRALYTEELAAFFLKRPPEHAVHDAERIAMLLSLPAQGYVFDQCCGIGALSIPLAGMGFKVVGVDLIEDYIAQARETALDSGLAEAQFQAGDARHFVAEACDGATTTNTSSRYAYKRASGSKARNSKYAPKDWRHSNTKQTGA